jgi:hypothetical protein
MSALRCVEVPGYSMRVVRVFDGPGPIPLATISVEPDGLGGINLIAAPNVPEDVIHTAAEFALLNPDPTL